MNNIRRRRRNYFALVFASLLVLTATLLCAPAWASDTGPDFGPNVIVFDPAMPAATIQSRLDAIYARQDANQFGPERYAVLFKPGHYDLDVKVGFYTQVLGLGRSPDDVDIIGAVHADADWLGNGNATCNFWRSCANLAVTPTSAAPLDWAVSQGTSLRRVHIKGDLDLWDRGWSSGGFLADSQVDGRVNSGSQQQWFSRNDAWGSWTGHNWNMVFLGVTNPPSGAWPQSADTVIAKTPVIQEEPYLSLDGQGRYSIMVPALQTQGTVGTSWAAGPTPGMSVPIDKFYLAHAGKDTAATLNTALDAGKNLLLTPGVYHLDAAIHVTRPGTIVLGLGYATLIPDRGTPALTVADVDGVKVGGLIFDAGPTESPVLMQIGKPGSTADHAKRPTFLYDIFARVGGAAAGTADSCVQINSRNVVGDNFWLWRADHGAGASWAGNRARSGLVVNGNDVTLYGLFVEHFQGYQTLWNGDRGRLYFYQSELPYDAPSQDLWQHDGVNGFASYKVADGVKSHEAYGLGIYGVFIHSPAKCANAVETPTASAVNIHHITSIWITGMPGTETTHVINDTGDTVNSAHHKATVE